MVVLHICHRMPRQTQDINLKLIPEDTKENYAGWIEGKQEQLTR
jgi:hypothetical protein